MTNPPGGSAARQSTPSTPQMARQQAGEVGSTAMESGQQVMQTVGDQTKRVAEEATRQARNLLDEGRQQLTEQARDGQQKTARSLHALADQLDDMYTKSDGSGIGPEVVHQAAGHARTAAEWLEGRQPGDLLDEVRGFARRKPGVFLAGAAVAGLLAGRLTRGVVAARKDDSSGDEEPGSGPATDRFATPPQPPVAAPQPVPGYTQPPPPAYSQPPAQGAVPPAWHGPGSGQQP